MKVVSEETRRRMSESAKRRCTDEWRRSKSESYSTPLPKHVVERLYSEGATQAEIGEFLGVSQKVIWGFMRRHGIKARVAAKRDQRGDKNHQWKGDGASYTAFHFRVEREFGKPMECEVCGTCDENKTYDWANLSGRYEDVTDYKRMCRSCHWKYDDRIVNIAHSRKDRSRNGE